MTSVVQISPVNSFELSAQLDSRQVTMMTPMGQRFTPYTVPKKQGARSSKQKRKRKQWLENQQNDHSYSNRWYNHMSQSPSMQLTTQTRPRYPLRSIVKSVSSQQEDRRSVPPSKETVIPGFRGFPLFGFGISLNNANDQMRRAKASSSTSLMWHTPRITASSQHRPSSTTPEIHEHVRKQTSNGDIPSNPRWEGIPHLSNSTTVIPLQNESRDTKPHEYRSRTDTPWNPGDRPPSIITISSTSDRDTKTASETKEDYLGSQRYCRAWITRQARENSVVSISSDDTREIVKATLRSQKDSYGEYLSTKTARLAAEIRVSVKKEKELGNAKSANSSSSIIDQGSSRIITNMHEMQTSDTEFYDNDETVKETQTTELPDSLLNTPPSPDSNSISSNLTNVNEDGTHPTASLTAELISLLTKHNQTTSKKSISFISHFPKPPHRQDLAYTFYETIHSIPRLSRPLPVAAKISVTLFWDCENLGGTLFVLHLPKLMERIYAHFGDLDCALEFKACYVALREMGSAIEPCSALKDVQWALEEAGIHVDIIPEQVGADAADCSLYGT